MSYVRKLYQEYASLLTAIENCRKNGNTEWEAKHTKTIRKLDELLPSGSGFDTGSALSIEESGPDRLVIVTSYHHMDEAGCYDGWSDHDVIVTPSLALEFNLRVTGHNKAMIKDYIKETFAIEIGREIDIQTLREATQ